MLITRRMNCIDAPSGIVTLDKWPSGAQVRSYRFADSLRAGAALDNWPSGAQVRSYRFADITCALDGHLSRVTIPDAASIQFILLVMSIKRSKHVEDYNKRTVKYSKCVSSWSLSKIIPRCTVNKT